MLSLALGSLVAGIFDAKYVLLPFPAGPGTISLDLALGNSSEPLLEETLMYNVAVGVERRSGSRKFGVWYQAPPLQTKMRQSTIGGSHSPDSPSLVTLGVSVFLLLAFVLLLYGAGVNYIPPGPLTMTFAILKQHYKIIPGVYHSRIFYSRVSSKASDYFLALIARNRCSNSFWKC